MIQALMSIWWLWLALAIVFAIIEVLAPGFIFLGFALGALVTGGLVWLGYAASGPIMLAVFAGASLVSWIGLRIVFRRQSSGAKIITRDVNDN